MFYQNPQMMQDIAAGAPAAPMINPWDNVNPFAKEMNPNLVNAGGEKEINMIEAAMDKASAALGNTDNTSSTNKERSDAVG